MANNHPIFRDIDRGDLEAVKQRVLADPAVLEERDARGKTPVIYATFKDKPIIALWLIEHRGQHDLNTQDSVRLTAMDRACWKGPLSVVQALVAAGSSAATPNGRGTTLLMYASRQGHTDIVAYLLQLPAIKASIDSADNHGRTALTLASYFQRISTMQLLLDAGADPTIPAGHTNSPLNRAIGHGHNDTAALLRHAIAEPDRARALRKTRALLDAARVISNARSAASDDDDEAGQEEQQSRRMRTRGDGKRKASAAALAYLEGRVERDEPLPHVELTPQQRRRQDNGEQQLRATVAHVVGLGDGKGLPGDLFVELLGYMLPAWADKGPALDAHVDSESEDEGSQEF